MRLYTKMPASLKQFFRKEITLAIELFDKKNYQLSWRHLERAHILGQPYPLEHTAVHLKMFLFGIKIKNWKEVVGQIPRLLVGGIKSFVGKIPVGNTGGADVPPLFPMEIPEDLLTIIRNCKKA